MQENKTKISVTYSSEEAAIVAASFSCYPAVMVAISAITNGGVHGEHPFPVTASRQSLRDCAPCYSHYGLSIWCL